MSTIPNNEENLALSAGNLTVQAYPNPFVNSTIIHFSSPVRQHVIVEIYNLRGQKVASLFDGTISRNEQRQVQFDASNLVDGGLLLSYD
ncbi:MAG: T9SS type A sorting domain-containing protein [Saprospiraceae bacterium]|nr:T9SS type A sorting domain-containing protein [Saprospiraceae bacterium]